ncbi:unnamed protein product [Didymodactylos carnosus]|uniref:Ectonucleoside triphosphate diphosphohydrolase 5 n=2 Tax=Didymodactylos carnosus TaxID=1234261 RepID=A0A814EFH9_9BILA|nr:unnamed protein product [Didymodactylos carnosus]CAF3740487.1 unnamed protein product [Didymodactylos carnosus]
MSISSYGTDPTETAEILIAENSLIDNKIVRHRQTKTCTISEDSSDTDQEREQSSLLKFLMIPTYFRYLKRNYFSSYNQNTVYSLFHLPIGDSKYRYSTRFIMKRVCPQTPLQTILCLLLFCVTSYIVYSSISLSPVLHLLDPYSYVIILDAGSTGTRVHVYKFRSHHDKISTYVLKSEIFEERKPGLSSYADHIDKASAQINDLVTIADKSISKFKHRATPIVLRATAGLRLLNETKSRDLLRAVSHTFDQYGFYRPKMDIAIMNETEEGIDAWLTLVYLKGEQFYSSKIAALDLGGGSTQITYNPSLTDTSLAVKLNYLLRQQQPKQPQLINAFRERDKPGKMPNIDVNRAGLEEIKPDLVPNHRPKIKEKNHVESMSTEKILNRVKRQEIQEPREDDESLLFMSNMHQFQMFGRDIQLYSRSYLGYGLMIARETIFMNETIDGRKKDSKKSNDYYEKLIRKEKLLKTHCMPKEIKGKFKFQEFSWQVESHTDHNSEEQFYQCISKIDEYIGTNVQKAVGLEQMTIYVFSYFYDAVRDAGLLSSENDEKSTIVTQLQIRTLKQTAKNICRGSTGLLEKHPFLCFDLTYMFSLLTKGYGLSEDINVNVCKKIQDFEVAWSLGLALKLL